MIKEFADISGQILEIAGILVILTGGIYATALFLYKSFRKKENSDATFKTYRNQLGRSILLGLEFLVGADIIQTVAVELNFENLGTLAVIVLIRTFLSFTLELELTGKWPWQQKTNSMA